MIRRILVAGTFLLGLFSSADAATRYISKTGSDTRSGISWDQAWLTLAPVNDTTRFGHGDTAVFGTGVWRDYLYVISGTGTDKTCYIDSSFLAGNHDTRVAWIYGSDSLGGWTRIGASNVYITSHTPALLDNTTTIWQNDSILWRQADSASVNTAGESWYGNGHIIAYVYGGDDPDNYDMEITAQNGIVIMSKPYTTGGGGQDNVSLVGLGFKYARSHAISDHSDGFAQQGWDSVLISHCYFSNCTGWLGGNPSLIYNGRAGIDGNSDDPYGSGEPDGYDYNRIVACSIGTAIAFTGATGTTLPQRDAGTNGDGMNFYGMRYSVIDSNVFFGYQSTNAIYFKCVNDASSGGATWDTVRFNLFNSKVGNALNIFGGSHHISIHGNIFNGATNNGILIGYSLRGVDSSGYHKIYNNTFYDCRMTQVDWYGGGSTYYHRHNEFKYNVVYRSTGYEAVWLDNLSFWDRIDSNMYFAASGTNTWESPTYTNNTWSQWQGRGVDGHSSSTINPGFANIAAGDFSRPTASGEMDRSYSGQRWTVYGAVQTSATTPVIGSSPAQFNFTILEGTGAPSDQTLNIFNAGIDDLYWQVSDNAGWLTLTPTSGINSGQVTVSVDQLAAGSYTANISITAAGVPNSPQVVPVYYTVTVPDYDPPIISFGPDSSLATASSNNIVWQTDEPATSRVEYGYTAAYGSFSPLDQTLVTAHSVALTGLSPETVYHFRVISRDASGNEAMSQDSTFLTPVQPDNLALGRPATVSGTYSGYVTGVICDGIIDPYGGTSTTWASDESSAEHWVEIDLQQSVPVSSVRICWANNGYTSEWMRSQRFTVQGWNGSSWNDLVTVDNIANEAVTYPDTVITYDGTGTPSGFSVTIAPPGDDTTITEAGFNSVVVSRIRIYQPASMGPATYPSIMWLTEIEVYTDDITPPTSKL